MECPVLGHCNLVAVALLLQIFDHDEVFGMKQMLSMPFYGFLKWSTYPSAESRGLRSLWYHSKSRGELERYIP